MTTRWFLACSLALCCLVSISCSESDAGPEPGPKTATTEETEASTNARKDLDAAKASLTQARSSIKAALQARPATAQQARPATAQQARPVTAQQTRRAKQPSNTNQKPGANSSVTPPENRQDDAQSRNAIDAATTALGLVDAPLGRLEKALVTEPGPQENIRTARTAIENALANLKTATEALATSDEDDTGESREANKFLQEAFDQIEEKALPALTDIKIPNDLQASSGWWSDTAWEILFWVVIIGGSILVLLLLFATGRALINSSAARADARIKSKMQPLVSAMQKQQTEVASELAKLATNQNDLRTRITDLEFEIKRVARIARDAANDGAGRRHSDPLAAFNSYETPAQKDEAVFPISIGDYLSKMRSSSNIVRPDFQNDILVSDPGGTGELVLIRDAAMPDDLQPLFVIPRAAQFQTKQDFYTYYQKYYECARPSAGDVWIIDPAVVSRVAGGWQLREKGVLEVR